MARALGLIAGLLAGVAVAVSGIAYFAVFVGLPSQDAPPELQATESFHANVASTLWFAGLAIVLATVVLGCALWIRSAVVRRRAMPRAGVR